jgi:hypothetical protein
MAIQPGDEAMGKNVAAEEEKRRLDRELDEQLEATFPASDALKIIRPRPTSREFDNSKAPNSSQKRSR